MSELTQAEKDLAIAKFQKAKAYDAIWYSRRDFINESIDEALQAQGTSLKELQLQAKLKFPARGRA